MTETLIIYPSLTRTLWFIKATDGFVLGSCKTKEEAVKCCVDMGYRAWVEDEGYAEKSKTDNQSKQN